MQELAWELGRFATRVMISDIKSLHSGKAWQSELVGDEISDGFMLCQKRLYILIPRILDEEARGLARSLSETAAQVVENSGVDEANDTLESMKDISAKLNERTGALLLSVIKFEHS